MPRDGKWSQRPSAAAADSVKNGSRGARRLLQNTPCDREWARVMEEKQIRRLAVLDRNKRLVGIVSLGDLAVRGDDSELSAEALQQISEPAAPMR